METQAMKTDLTRTDNDVRQELPLVSPRVDIYEGEAKAMVVAELPGVAKEDLSVKIEKGILTIAGTTETARYERSFAINENVDAESIEAHYKNGLLRVEFALRAAKTQRIEVKAA
jgi:HSP20 family molecular chaperone IbpA